MEKKRLNLLDGKIMNEFNKNRISMNCVDETTKDEFIKEAKEHWCDNFGALFEHIYEEHKLLSKLEGLSEMFKPIWSEIRALKGEKKWVISRI